MGKATRWFRRLIGVKRPDPDPTRKPPTNDNGWSFVKSYFEHSNSVSRPISHGYDTNKSLTPTKDGHDDFDKRVSSGEDTRVWAVIIIQSYFRGYLARKALGALKGVVKLQGVVRGHIVRRKTIETMQSMQALLRAQSRAISLRTTYRLDSPHSTTESTQLHLLGTSTPEKFEQFISILSSKHDQSPKIKRNDSRSSSRESTINQDRVNFDSSRSDPRIDKPTSDPRLMSSTRKCKTGCDQVEKILEIEKERTRLNLRRRNPLNSFNTSLPTSNNVSTTHHKGPHPSKFSKDIDDSSYRTAENSSHQLNSATSLGASSREGPSMSTTTKSGGSRSFRSVYSDQPSYMACTESSRAKVKSVSTSTQIPRYERSTSSIKRYPVHGSNGQKMSEMQGGFRSTGSRGSGRFSRVTVPVSDSTIVYYSGYLN